jgi:hypothetical protein
MNRSSSPPIQARPRDRATRLFAVVHGAFFVVGGLWPVLNLRTFAFVTGKKPEGWLVKTVGLLMMSVGSSLIMAAKSGDRGALRTARLLGLTSSMTLGSIALFYAAKRRISPVYFLDAMLEGSIALGWSVISLLPKKKKVRLAAA